MDARPIPRLLQFLVFWEHAWVCGHVFGQQARLPSFVSRDQPQPGDLVFVNGNSHVGLYAGNDQVLHAPEAGQNVQYTNINWLGHYESARRY